MKIFLDIKLNFQISSTVSDSDFISVTMTLTFTAGQTTVPIPVTTTNDIISELTETFFAQLSNPSAGVVLGGQSRASVDILDNDGN